MRTKQFTYQSLDDDLVQSPHQNQTMPADYHWELPRRGWKVKTIRALFATAAWCYSRLWLGVKVVGHDKLAAAADQGYVIYGNHTQPVNDAAMPLLALGPQHFYVIAAPANWGIPVIGPLLRYAGGIPVGHDLKTTRAMLTAVHQALEQGGHLMIYPEAHVWPGYTKIRPFEATSFRFPAKEGVPVYTITTTYQGWRWNRQPKIVAYVDGPFTPPARLDTRESQQWLHDRVAAQLKERAQLNTIEPYHYQQRKED